MSQLAANLQLFLTIVLILLTSCIIQCRPGISTVSLINSESTTSTSIDNGGCLVSFTGPNNDIPVQTSGSTTLPPYSSGGPSQTVPCAKFLAYIMDQAKSQNETPGDAPSTASSSTTDTSARNTPTTLLPPITSQASALATRTSRQTLSYCRPNVTTVNSEYDIYPPTFTDLNLEGCYAGTGGLTSRTFTSGQIKLPESGYSFIGTNGDFVATLPCSEFMTLNNIDSIDSLIPRSFQRSPICTSYADWFNKQGCSLNDQVLMPPGVLNYHLWNSYDCCGGCNIFEPPHVRILYWPPDTTSDCSNLGTTTKVNHLLSTSTGIKPRSVGDQSVANPRLAVVDGITLTSPSLYMTFSGTLQVTDRCGFLGANYTSPIIPVPAGGLSTLSYVVPFHVQQGVKTGAYDPAACATYGASNKTTYSTYGEEDSKWYTYSDFYTFGPPYNPILVPPPEVYNFDPKWAACTRWYTGGEENGGFTYGIFDPPRMLTPVAMADGPSSTSAGAITQHSNWATPTQPARPGSVGIPDTPTITAGPVFANDPGEEAVPGFFEPTERASDAISPEIQLAEDTVTPANTVAKEGALPLASVDAAGRDKASSRASPGGTSQPVHQSLIPDADPIYHLGEDTLWPGGPEITIDNVPYSLAASAAALKSGSKTIELAKSRSAMPALELGGQPYTANDASQYVVGSKTMVPGGLAVTIEHDVYSIPSSVTVLISNGYTTPLVARPGDPPLLTIAGQKVSPYTLAPPGTVLTKGSSTVNIEAHRTDMNGDPIASQARNENPAFQGGDLTFVIGSSTTVLRPSAHETVAPVITIDSILYTANSASAFIIGAQTLAPGSPALTIDSTVYSLPLPSPSAASGSLTRVSNTSIPPMAGEVVLTIASALYTCRQNTPCTIASQILLPNGSITVGADTIVYGPAGIDVVRGTTTVVQGSPSVSRGDVITSHIDGLTPIPENTAAAARPETGGEDAEAKGTLKAIDLAKLYIVPGLVVGALLI